MRFQFGDFIVDHDARRLLRCGREQHLSPKAFDLLVTLVRERPRVLAKASLHALLWPDTFVSDASLAMLVAEVRAALGETAREPRWIRTAHRQGYAFQGIAQEVVNPPPVAPGLREAPASAPGCWLVTSSGQVPLLPSDNLVGRDPAVRVWIDSPSVSRHHARIRVEGDQATVEDLGSKNGTRVRDVRVMGPVALADGDGLRFGSVDVIFRTWTAEPTRTEGDG